jgi:hypothetical protein
MYIMVISFCLCSKEDQQLLGYSIWFPFLSYCAHRLVVSLKYATLSPTEYQRFCDCKDKALSVSYLNQMMLFGGWAQLIPLVLYFEVAAASANINDNISKIFLIIRSETLCESTRSQLLYWNAFLQGQEIIDIEAKLSP